MIHRDSKCQNVQYYLLGAFIACSVTIRTHTAYKKIKTCDLCIIVSA
jgi:hypothetical protein